MKSPLVKISAPVVLVLVLALAAVPASGAERWEYSGERGPAHWGSMRPDYATCDRGTRQSPINIAETRKERLPDIQFHYRPAPLRLVNDGHTVRFRIANGSRITIGRESYRLRQFHFHVPGGDQIRGQEFDMAAHFVHKSDAGQLAVVVVLFRRGQENPALVPLWSKLPEHAGREQAFPEITVDATRLLPAEKGYYAFDGSLTAPPCTEGVRWFVLRQPVELSAQQFEKFRTLFPLNIRPVQPLHGRVVKESL